MADDWIKVRENLHEEPEVLQMASMLETRPEHVVGYCIRFWGWVSRNVSPDDRDNCPGGCVTGVPLVSVESVLNLPGFLTMMCEVGWLKYEKTAKSHVITVPKMDKHLSETAKKRALEAQKKRKQRSKNVPDNSGHCPSENGTRSDQIRSDLDRLIKEGNFKSIWDGSDSETQNATLDFATRICRATDTTLRSPDSHVLLVYAHAAATNRQMAAHVDGIINAMAAKPGIRKRWNYFDKSMQKAIEENGHA